MALKCWQLDSVYSRQNFRYKISKNKNTFFTDIPKSGLATQADLLILLIYNYLQ